MSALDLIQALSTAVFLFAFLLTAIDAARRRTRAAVDTAVFFGVLAAVVVEGRVVDLLKLVPPEVVRDVVSSLVLALPYLMLRLLSDFTWIDARMLRASEAGLAVSVLAVFLLPTPLTVPATLALVAYFVLLSGYVASSFFRLARRSPGVTRRRMEAVALGNGLLGLAVLVGGLAAAVPLGGVGAATTQLLALGAGLSWVLGFAPPPQLRRYWQEPELRAFLARAARLPRLPDTDSIVGELERGAASSLGARATIGIWDPPVGVLRFRDPHAALPNEMGPSRHLAWRVFESQRAAFVPDAAAAHPEHAPAYAAARVGPVLLAPITAGERRLGVLEVFAERQPIFTQEDLALVELLAEQAAVILESRALIDEAARVRAQEEAARLKEDFISAAAHDLKTPLTTLVMQAQLLERRFASDPTRADALPAVQRISRESRRLSSLVEELLDASRIEQGQLDLRRETVDLGALVREACERRRERRAAIHAEVSGELVGSLDPQRVRQLLENLLENAEKYSSPDDPIEVRAFTDGGEAHIAVRDEGIGIPLDDQSRLFERFQRARNVDDRRYAGLGLGLYICRGIAEQHGGRIWVESAVGQGSTFHVTLPLQPERKLN